MKTLDSSTVIQRFVGTLSSWRSWGSKWDAVLIWEFTECCRPCKSPHLTMKESFIKRFLCFNFQELFIYLLFGHTHGMCQFLGQGSNLCHSSNLSCHSDRQHGILNLLRHQGTTQEQLQPSFAVTKNKYLQSSVSIVFRLVTSLQSHTASGTSAPKFCFPFRGVIMVWRFHFLKSADTQ